ncbi:MAG: methylenetetrahydrofolate reductase, partial [Desulfobacterales bacterium]|nr:methylenetetrahydrofolate reductase [Desulfobacterales bacterium]
MKLKEALKKKQFVVTSEIQAPIDQEPEDLVQSLSRVRGRVDGVSLSEVEFEGVVGDTIKTCRLLDQNQFEPIYQTTTRDKNRLQLQKDLVEAHEAG